MKVAVIENGGQYTHVIWRTVRDLGHEVKVFPNKTPFEELASDGYILGGGPGSAYKDDFGVCAEIIKGGVENNCPVLGICLGHQLIGHLLGGIVARGPSAEYGLGELFVDEKDVLFQHCPKKFNVWVSHFDEVKQMPQDFVKLAHSKTCSIEAMHHKTKLIFGVQFHPEVWHTENGERILKNFFECIEKSKNPA